MNWFNTLSSEGFPGGSAIKNLPANAGDPGLISGWRRSPGGGHGNPFQYSCLGNSMHRGAWWATFHGVAKSWIQLKRLSTHICTLSNKCKNNVLDLTTVFSRYSF